MPVMHFISSYKEQREPLYEKEGLPDLLLGLLVQFI